MYVLDEGSFDVVLSVILKKLNFGELFFTILTSIYYCEIKSTFFSFSHLSFGSRGAITVSRNRKVKGMEQLRSLYNERGDASII